MALGAAIGAVGLLLTVNLTAAEHEHGPHEHGVGHLNVAIEGDTVELQLISPADDIVGFEHWPETAEDKAAVDAAVERLSDGSALFLLPADAACELLGVTLESELLAAERSDSTHADFEVGYRFRCERPDRLDSMEVKLFEAFPGTHELEVQVISPAGQSAHELTPDSPRLEL